MLETFDGWSTKTQPCASFSHPAADETHKMLGAYDLLTGCRVISKIGYQIRIS